MTMVGAAETLRIHMEMRSGITKIQADNLRMWKDTRDCSSRQLEPAAALTRHDELRFTALIAVRGN